MPCHSMDPDPNLAGDQTMVGRVAPQDLRGQGAIMVISTICQKAVELSSRQSIPSKKLRRKKKSAHHTQSKDFNGGWFAKLKMALINKTSSKITNMQRNTHIFYLAAPSALRCTRRSAHLIRTRSVRLYPSRNVRPNMKKFARTCGEMFLKYMLKTSVKLTMSTPAKSTGRPTLMVTRNGKMTLQHAKSSQRPSASL